MCSSDLPPSVLADFVPDADTVSRVIATALGEQRSWLAAEEVQTVLAAYGIPIAASRLARDADDAARIAAEIGGKVALKIRSPDITHKSDVGGVALNLDAGPEAGDVGAAGFFIYGVEIGRAHV